MADSNPNREFVTAQSLGADPDTFSRQERRLFTTLARHADRVFTKEELIRSGVARGTRELDGTACRLRARFDGERVVVNVWGVGYRLLDGDR